MAGYLDESDTDEEGAVAENTFTEAEISDAIGRSGQLKQLGNEAFSAGDYDTAISTYSEALNLLKSVGKPRDPIILLNRSASYIALKRYVPALNDANQAAKQDPDNWKGHWRKGVSLMNMAKRVFRTKQAIEAFEKCLQCSTLPANKVDEVRKELAKAQARMEQQEDEMPPPDLSKCAPS